MMRERGCEVFWWLVRYHVMVEHLQRTAERAVLLQARGVTV